MQSLAQFLLGALVTLLLDEKTTGQLTSDGASMEEFLSIWIKGYDAILIVINDIEMFTNDAI